MRAKDRIDLKIETLYKALEYCRVDNGLKILTIRLVADSELSSINKFAFWVVMGNSILEKVGYCIEIKLLTYFCCANSALIMRFGTWLVPVISESRNGIVLEGPVSVCKQNQVVGWHTSEDGNKLRRFHVAMLGFAFNSTNDAILRLHISVACSDYVDALTRRWL